MGNLRQVGLSTERFLNNNCIFHLSGKRSGAALQKPACLITPDLATIPKGRFGCKIILCVTIRMPYSM